jgi:bla regulator protein BlaR1
MFIYILKFSACLGVFLAFYKLFLERENMHQFKRFYLIGIVLTSIIIPFITFTEYVEPQPILENFSATAFLPTETVSIAIENPTNYLSLILWSIYGLGFLLFGLKFGYNLVQLIVKIKKNPKQKASNFINVLLKDWVAPHTFFSYIFLNKHKYETHQIPQEVLLHEQTHAKQKHSLDVLFIEVLQIILWFNPLVYFIKNSIKLNHEFLADKAVLNNGIQPTKYQRILLAFSSNNNEPELANAINYSSIKKRLTVMKTHTSNQKIWLRSFILLPLLALTLYGFSDRVEIIKEKNQLELLRKSNNELPVEIKSQIVNEDQDGASREQMKEYERLAKYYNTQDEKARIIKLNDYNRLKYLYDLMSAKQKKSAEAFPNFPPPPAIPATNAKQNYPIPPPIPENATQEQREKMQAAIDDFEKKYKRKVHTLKAGENGELLNLIVDDEEFELPPPPPPPIPENATSAQKEKYKKVTEEYKIKYTIKNGMVSENPPPPPPPIPENATEAQKKKYSEAIERYKLRSEKMAYQEARVAKIKTEKGELARVKEIKPPKPPKSSLDHVINMAKKDAVFYLEGKKISSDKAIEALKKNKALNIQTLDSNSKQPKVYISKKPIIIGVKGQEGKTVSKGDVVEIVEDNFNYAIINKVQVSGVSLNLSIDEFKKLSITHKKHKVTSFSIMFPDNKAFKINGNTLNAIAKSKTETLKQGQVITLFEIKTDGNETTPPVLIEIKNK